MFTSQPKGPNNMKSIDDRRNTTCMKSYRAQAENTVLKMKTKMSELERDTRRDSLALKAEGGPTSQGTLVASRS